MFNDVGKEIKQMAVVIMLAVTLAFVVVGILVDALAGTGGVVTAVLAVIGLLIGRYMGLFLYSWGEVVYRISRIEQKLPTNEANAPAQANYQQQAVVSGMTTPLVMTESNTSKDGRWFCSRCGYPNVAGSGHCQNCFNPK